MKAPGEAAARPVSLEWLAGTAMLLPGMGEHTRAIGAESKEAQAYFDQGLNLLYGFNHDEAARSFAKAAALDPMCAMCFWGVSIALGPNYNMPMLRGRTALAWEALVRARKLAGQAREVDQALIGALSKRYVGPLYSPPSVQHKRDEAYAAAMREVAAAYPEDADVQVLFAESLMDLDPWRLWTASGQPRAQTMEIVRTLEEVLARAPLHPGANHYYIHAVEASTQPSRGLAAAERLRGLVPGAGHLVHMPAHIFARVGRWEEASAQNRAAAEVDVRAMKRLPPWGYYPMYLAHNYAFLSYTSAMEGRRAESLQAARDAAGVLDKEMLRRMPGMEIAAAAPLQAMVRFGRWEELLEEPRPEPRFLTLDALWLYARGMALAAKQRIPDARARHAELVKRTADVSPGQPAGNNKARDVMDLAAKVLEASIAERARDPGAIEAWTAAVELSDELAYGEPPDWFFPVRHALGAALIDAGKFAEAEAVYREDLGRNPENGWALFGLARALRGQGSMKEAAEVEQRFEKAWARAELRISSSAY
ncbi:MAG: hypothetical protein R3B70_07890 [Polyangiaceae bacterium]